MSLDRLYQQPQFPDKGVIKAFPIKEPEQISSQYFCELFRGMVVLTVEDWQATRKNDAAIRQRRDFIKLGRSLF